MILKHLLIQSIYNLVYQVTKECMNLYLQFIHNQLKQELNKIYYQVLIYMDQINIMENVFYFQDLE